ncbi:sigma-70 RNA polymerase sigma factor region 4 domain-containing protein [Facklamia miroungae]|uniref:RNA polymerase sigma factor, sigma-70 family n=1 Tax=Facklamia miroungae TaxID=120956 RepID=A0A1G7PIS3_9LACT|nr:sigma-70 family RNA polymerase sigma factor [Facklamia miroungae]NKZ28702.1 sigma-70 family RNA polymerase sigma factor [Facklamia miroungae]SDF85290.1 hypothetical protein SAMN05421791_101244 [Facklamia miroungae]
MVKSKAELEKVVILFDPLIHHWLHHYQIASYDCDYQDHLQEMRIELLELYQRFEGDPLNNQDDRYQFVAYAGKGLRWFLLNRLRKSKYTVTPTDPFAFNHLLEAGPNTSQEEAVFLLKETAKQYLTGREWKVFNLLLSGRWLNHEICQLTQVSERTLRYDKERIGHKLRNLLKDIGNNFILLLPFFMI